jgi:ribosomal protein S12 methylthiotransferase accessory factor
VREDFHPLGDRRSQSLARALGVTRVARVTGLDRTGVEVASAVRPGGHVLQVTSGKGATFKGASRGALMEAAELFGAEHPDPAAVLAATSAAALRVRAPPGVMVLGPAELAPGAEGRSAEGLRIAWRVAAGLLGGRAAWVPCEVVHCPPPGGPVHPALLRWTSNGMGAHPNREAALLHALLEAIERDQLARALPDGFTRREITRRLLHPASLAAAAPRAAALAARLERRGFRVHLLDCSPPALDLGLPVAAAVVVDVGGGPVPVAAGYACRLSRDGALEAALLEAAQSRATEIHGAREDVAVGDRHAAAPLARLLAAAHPRRLAGALPDARAASPTEAVRQVLRRLRRAGHHRAAVVDLAAPEGIAVVKVVVPGLLLSELL